MPPLASTRNPVDLTPQAYQNPQWLERFPQALDVIAADPGQPQPATPRPFGIDGISRSGLVGWALACDDIDATVARARHDGYDLGEATDGQRTGPTGTVLHWRMTGSPTADGLVPFLISWGDTEHPARSAPRGLTLETFHLEHPDPPSVAPWLAALGADVEIRPAAMAARAAATGERPIAMSCGCGSTGSTYTSKAPSL